MPFHVVTDGLPEEVPVTALVPHPENPNRGNLAVIGESIAENGWYGSVIAQRSTRRILAGEHRWRSAIAAGAETVPVEWADVDDAHAMRILLAHNRTAQLARLDTEALADVLVTVNASVGDLVGTGFDAQALRELTQPPAPPAQERRPREGRPRSAREMRQHLFRYEADDYLRVMDKLRRLKDALGVHTNAEALLYAARAWRDGDS